MNLKFPIPILAILILLVSIATWNSHNYDFYHYQQQVSEHLEFKKAFRKYILMQRRKEKAQQKIDELQLNSYALGARMTEIFSAIHLKDPDATIEVIHALEKLLPKDMQANFLPLLLTFKQDVSTNQWETVNTNLDRLYKNLMASRLDKIKFNFGQWLAQVYIAYQEDKDLRYHASASKYFSKKLPKKDVPKALFTSLEKMQIILSDHPVNNEHLVANLEILGKLLKI